MQIDPDNPRQIVYVGRDGTPFPIVTAPTQSVRLAKQEQSPRTSASTSAPKVGRTSSHARCVEPCVCRGSPIARCSAVQQSDVCAGVGVGARLRRVEEEGMATALTTSYATVLVRSCGCRSTCCGSRWSTMLLAESFSCMCYTMAGSGDTNTPHSATSTSSAIFSLHSALIRFEVPRGVVYVYCLNLSAESRWAVISAAAAPGRRCALALCVHVYGDDTRCVWNTVASHVHS